MGKPKTPRGGGASPPEQYFLDRGIVQLKVRVRAKVKRLLQAKAERRGVSLTKLLEAYSEEE